jgi:hypothetical protein
MAPTDQEILTYHVVPRFDIPAKGGPLSLGTIVNDLKTLVPLNSRQNHVKVPDELIYAPVTHTDYKDTLVRARSANFNAWVKALGLPVGGSVDAGGSKDIEKTISCESVVTTYFDPDPAGDYLQECLAVRPIQDRLKTRAVDLYLVTGLKVAKKLSFNKSTAGEQHAEVSAEAKEPQTNAVDTGMKAGASDKKKQELEFGTNDIVIGFRVNKYRCTRSLFSRSSNSQVNDEGIVNGNMMHDARNQNQLVGTGVEALQISEETSAQEQARVEGATECWVKFSD